MIEMLRAQWNGTLSWPELISLTERLGAMLQEIRRDRHILPPMMTCPHCRMRHRVAPPRVSVRAMILALERFGIAGPVDVRSLDKGWKKCRELYALDLYVKKAAEGPASSLCGNGP